MEQRIYRRDEIEAQAALAGRTFTNYADWGIVMPLEPRRGRRAAVYDATAVVTAVIARFMLANRFGREDAAAMAEIVRRGLRAADGFAFCRYRPDRPAHRGKPDPEADFVLDFQNATACRALERQNPERGFKRLLGLGEWVRRLLLELEQDGRIRSAEPGVLEFWED